MINALISAKIPIASHVGGSTKYSDVVFLPIHIHGNVNSIILGLNDESQIKNESLQSNSELTSCIIKKNVNDALGELRIESVKQTMEKSKYICVFGMSIGDTDNMWWVSIIEWLLNDDTRKLVLFVYDSSTVQVVSSQEYVRLKRRNTANITKRKNNLDEAQIKNLNKRIIIVKNPKIFNFQNIEIKEETTDI